MTDLPESEPFLFQRIASGDETAFEALFHLFLPRIYPFAIKFTKSEQGVKEVIQETFIRVWMNRHKLSEVDNPGGWLFKVASNECYSYVRKKALNDSLFGSLSDETQSREQVNAVHEKMDLKDLTMLITEAVNLLPAQRKKIYQLSRHEGKTIPEIASILGISPSTAKNTLVIALKFIRKYLARHGVNLMAITVLLLQ